MNILTPEIQMLQFARPYSHLYLQLAIKGAWS